jgi:hypothetical protein
MKDVHITRELLESLYKLDMPPEVFVRLVWDHLQALCPECSEAVDSWLSGARRRGYDSAFEKALTKVEAHAREVGEESRKVDREFAELLRLAPEEAVRRIIGASKRFRSPHLVERLIEESEKHLHGDPRRSVELLECARAIVDRPQETGGSRSSSITATLSKRPEGIENPSVSLLLPDRGSRKKW